MAEWLPPIFDENNSQAARQLARRLAAYLPRTLSQQILRRGLPVPGSGNPIQAAVIFADVSGFTHLSEMFAQEGPQGVERLNRALLYTFTPLINAIHDAGGAVSRFHGDAMMVYFPDDDGQAALRALATARFMQNLVESAPPPGTTRLLGGISRRLTIKIGVGYGRCLEMVLGEEGHHLEFVLAGTAVDEAASAEEQAHAGQIMASQAVLAKAGLNADTPFRLVTETLPIPGVRSGFYWDAYEPAAIDRLLKYAPDFLPPAIYQRLQTLETQSIAEHRPVTSMFVRFEGLGTETPESSFNWQTYYLWAWQLVARFGGEFSRVNHVLTGDKGCHLHIIFGAPVAPDAPEAAVRCALAMQRERPSFIAQQKIGITAGRAFAGAVGSQTRRDYTIVGKAVNLSARLVTVCPDGGVVVDASLADRLAGAFVFGEQTAVSLKGHSRPVAICRVQAEKSSPGFQSRYSQSLLHVRQKEREQLAQAAQKVWQGEPVMVGLTGAVGSGIRELANVCKEDWLAQGGQVLTGICEKHNMGAPYSAWKGIWHEFWGITAVSGPQAAQLVLEKAQHLAPEEVRNMAAWLLAMGLPLTEEISSDTKPLDSGQLRLFGVVQACLAAAAEKQQPLMLVFEDVQWADQPSRDLLHYLAAQPGLGQVFILLLERGTSAFTQKLHDQAQAQLIVLGELNGSQAHEAALHYLGVSQLPEALNRRLGLANGGQISPFFLLESLKGMVEAGVVTVENGRIQVDEAALSRLKLPDTIHAWLLSRLDRLSPTARHFIQIAAVIGRDFTRQMVMDIAPNLSLARVDKVLHELTQMGLIEPVEGTDSYLFSSAQIHDVVYQSLPYARRQALHSEVADWLWKSQQNHVLVNHTLLAYHFSRAQRHEQALHFAHISGDEAASVFAFKEAVDLYRLAQFHWTELGAENTAVAIELLHSEAKALIVLGQLGDAFRAAQDALEKCLQINKISLSYDIRLLMAQISLLQGRYKQAQRIAQIVVNRTEGDAAHFEVMMAANYWYLQGLLQQHQWKTADFLVTQLEEDMERLQNGDLRARFLLAQAELAWGNGMLTVAAAQFAEALTWLADGAMPWLKADVLLRQSALWWQLGQVAAAETAVQDAIAQVRTISPIYYTAALRQKIRLLLYLGNLAEVQTLWPFTVALQQNMDDPLGWIDTQLLAARLAKYQLLPLAESWENLRAAQALLARQTPDELVTLSLRMNLWLAELALLRGDLQQAGSALRKGGAVAGKYGCVLWRPRLFYLQAVLKIREGAHSLARQLLQAAADAVAQGGDVNVLPLVLLAQAQLAEDAEERLERLWACLETAVHRASYLDRRFLLAEIEKMPESKRDDLQTAVSRLKQLLQSGKVTG